MPICKFCNVAFSWGLKDDGKWVPLVPVGEEGDQPRSYQDENGVLRVEHATICRNRGGPSVRVARLARAIPASDVFPVKDNRQPPGTESAPVATPYLGPNERLDEETGEIKFTIKRKRPGRKKGKS